MTKNLKPKPPPTLFDLIDTWMKKELPKAKYEEVIPTQTLMPRFKRITILKKINKKNARPCFSVELHPTIAAQAELRELCREIGTNATSVLMDVVCMEIQPTEWAHSQKMILSEGVGELRAALNAVAHALKVR